MSDARAEVLERVARARATAQAAVVPRTYRRTGELQPDERVARFCERVDDYRADVVRIALGDVAAVVQELCVRREIGSLVIPPALPWHPHGVELVEDHGLTPHELDRVGGALTGCTVAVAETGTIILTAGPSEGRRALTLVPDLHICVVRESQICELVPEALARIVEQGLAERPITFVSGPSATSDIELDRVEGVHGPRDLVVLVAKEEGT